jgi:FkbM family methyltransferase
MPFNLSKTASSLFFGLGNFNKRFFDKIGRMLYRPTPTRKDEAWGAFCDAGGEEMRFNYDSLDKDSIVFDLGGYEGQWASDIYGRFQSKIYLFEVHQPFYDKIKKRFQYNGDIKCYNFGLASKNGVAQISIDEVSTSAFKHSANMVEVNLTKASDFIAANDIKSISLMKINIEGAEYDLLEHLADSGVISIIQNLQIQFHDFVPDARALLEKVRVKLLKTHTPTYQFDFIWENWKLNEKH